MALTERTQPYRLTLAWKDDGAFQGAEFYTRQIIERDGVVISDQPIGPSALAGSAEALGPFLDAALQGSIDLAAEQVATCAAALQRAADAEEARAQAQALAMQKQGEFDDLVAAYVNVQGKMSDTVRQLTDLQAEHAATSSALSEAAFKIRGLEGQLAQLAAPTGDGAA